MVKRCMAEGGEYLIHWDGHRCSESQYQVIWKSLAERLQIPGTLGLIVIRN